MLPGVKIMMGGTEWIVPPLTLGQLRRLQSQIEQFGKIAVDGSMTPEAFDAIGTVISAALSRNYPDMTPEKALDLVDIGNAHDVMMAVLSGSGLRRGEAIAAASLNGAKSMASSPPDLDIPIPQ